MSIIDYAVKLVPLIRNRKVNKYDFLNDIEQYWTEHRNRVTENWYLYLGYHNIFFSRFDGESESDYIKRVENAVIENHIQPVIDILSMYLYGKDVVRYVKRNDEVDKKLMDILRNRVWNHNSGIYDDIKTVNTLVTGYTLIQRSLFDYRTDKPFLITDSIIDKAKYGYVKKIPLDSMCAIPLPYIIQDDVECDGRIIYDKFGGVLFYAEYDNLIANSEIMQLLGRTPQFNSIIEYIDDTVWIRFIKRNDGEWINLFAIDNPYRRVDTIFTLYKNSGDPFHQEGESEITKIKKLNIDLNELSDGDRNVIRSHQYPILLGKGGARLPNNFIRTKDAVIDGIEGDGTFEYLTWTGNLEESRMRQEVLRKVIGYVTGISGITRGIIENLGQVRSGSPLKALLSSDRITRLRKIRNFESAERSEMLADLRFYEASLGMNLELTPDLEFNVEYEDDFLDLDKLITEEINALRLQSGVTDIETILREEYPDWTEDQIKDIVSKINTRFSERSNSKKVKGVRKSVERSQLEQDLNN